MADTVQWLLELEAAKKSIATLTRERDEALSAEHAAAKENEALTLAYERLSEELSKPEDVRLREATEVMAGYAEHLGPSLADRISFELDEQDRWISRAGEAEREVEQLREHPVVWADDATPFDGPQVAALLAENESLRAAVRAADAVFAAQDHPVFAKGEEKALADWREARAKCGGVT